MSNDHADALQEWMLSEAEDGMTAVATVLHVDAHNDLNVPVPEIKEMHPVPRQRARRELNLNSMLRNQTVCAI